MVMVMVMVRIGELDGESGWRTYYPELPILYRHYCL